MRIVKKNVGTIGMYVSVRSVSCVCTVSRKAIFLSVWTMLSFLLLLSKEKNNFLLGLFAKNKASNHFSIWDLSLSQKVGSDNVMTRNNRLKCKAWALKTNE